MEALAAMLKRADKGPISAARSPRKKDESIEQIFDFNCKNQTANCVNKPVNHHVCAESRGALKLLSALGALPGWMNGDWTMN